MSDFLYAPCTLDDVPALADIYIRAFGANDTNQVIFPPTTCSDADLREWLIARFGNILLRKQGAAFFKISEASTGRIVAWSRWAFPQSHEIEPTKAVHTTTDQSLAERYPKGANIEACEAFFQGLHAMLVKYADKSNMYIVHVVATDPDYQRRGLGKMLLEQQLARLDIEGKKAYIESTPAGYGLYLKFGWKDVDVFNIDLQRWGGNGSMPYRIMIREPQQGEGVAS